MSGNSWTPSPLRAWGRHWKWKWKCRPTPRGRHHPFSRALQKNLGWRSALPGAPRNPCAPLGAPGGSSGPTYGPLGWRSGSLPAPMRNQGRLPPLHCGQNPEGAQSLRQDPGSLKCFPPSEIWAIQGYPQFLEGVPGSPEKSQKEGQEDKGEIKGLVAT